MRSRIARKERKGKQGQALEQDDAVLEAKRGLTILFPSNERSLHNTPHYGFTVDGFKDSRIHMHKLLLSAINFSEADHFFGDVFAPCSPAI